MTVQPTKHHSINRRHFMKNTAAGSCIGASLSSFGASSTHNKPNIVLIVSDDQGYGDVSYQSGHPDHVDTPNIDRLANDGVRFSNGYASAWVCAPTRAGLLTGRYQQRFGFYTASDSRVGLPQSETTIAEILKREGYKTGVFGKWHLGLEQEYHPCERGFDEFYGFLGHGAHDYFDLSIPSESLHNAIYRDREIISDEGYLTDNLAREAVSFINRHQTEPFFLYLPFNAVHAPMQAPAEDINRFNTGNKDRDIYLGMLHRMDIAIGNVLDAIKNNGLEENTIVYFFSDNGGAKINASNNSPLRAYKQHVYEGGIRVPFIAKWPGHLPANHVCDEPVISMDFFTSICAAVDVPLPNDNVYDGIDLVSIANQNPDAATHESLFWKGTDQQWGIRSGKWKLLSNKKGDVELYNLEADISEKNNVIGDHSNTAAQLQQKFNNWEHELAPRIKKKK